MSFNAVQQILDQELISVGLPSALQTENTQISINTGSPWVRSTMAPAESQNASIGVGAINHLNGLYQIDLFYPVNTGTMAARTLGDAICSQMHQGLTLTDGTYSVVIENSWQGVVDTFVESGQIRLPVMVRWSCYR